MHFWNKTGSLNTHIVPLFMVTCQSTSLFLLCVLVGYVYFWLTWFPFSALNYPCHFSYFLTSFTKHLPLCRFYLLMRATFSFWSRLVSQNSHVGSSTPFSRFHYCGFLKNSFLPAHCPLKTKPLFLTYGFSAFVGHLTFM